MCGYPPAGDFHSGVYVLDAFTTFDIVWDQRGCYLSDPSDVHEEDISQSYLMQNMTLEENLKINAEKRYWENSMYDKPVRVPSGKYTLDYGIWKIPITINDIPLHLPDSQFIED